jgi:hypothetical protein
MQPDIGIYIFLCRTLVVHRLPRLNQLCSRKTLSPIRSSMTKRELLPAMKEEQACASIDGVPHTRTQEKFNHRCVGKRLV